MYAMCDLGIVQPWDYGMHLPWYNQEPMNPAEGLVVLMASSAGFMGS